MRQELAQLGSQAGRAIPPRLPFGEVESGHCSCGDRRKVNGSNLRSGRSTRCGICSGREQPMIGREFVRLTVLRQVDSQRYEGPDGKHRYTRSMWACKCS